jgi:type I restriction enzyme S subunit
MIADLKPYPEYKESGIPWIGNVPSDWRVERTKCIFRSRKELNVGRQNTNVLSLTLRGVVNNDPESPEGMVPKDYATYQLFKKHDLVFKLIDLENIRTSRVGLVHEDGIMSSAYVRLAPTKSVIIRFFYLQFFDLYTRAVFNALGAGVRSTLGAADLGELRIVIPPPAEQAAIVRFLDHWNGRLEKAIRAKRRVIALLQEQKQAIIHRAVTRGLDPNVKLKDSGIPWLGEIPEHWDVSRVKNEFECLNNRRIPLSSPERGRMTRRDYDYYGASGVIDRVDDYIFDDDLLLIAEDGANLVLRNLPLAIIARGKFWVNNHAHILKPKGSDLEYLQAVMEGINYRPWISGAAQPKLTKDRVLAISIAVAPREEQQAIMDFVHTETAPITTAIARYEREISLLREYRTRLTADVVTGKLDVRAAAAQLPEEAEEEPLPDPEIPEEETELGEVEA